jgi:hypothetical protein
MNTILLLLYIFNLNGLGKGPFPVICLVTVGGMKSLGIVGYFPVQLHRT